MSGTRHPRAGTGSGYGYYGGHYGGGYGGHYGSRYGYRPYYGHGYRPYYYGGYYGPSYGFGVYGGYYSPGFYGSISIGSPYYPAPYYAPYSYPAPSGTNVYIVGSDDSGGYARPSDDEVPWGRLRLEVRPDDATVYVDDQFRGSARAARSLRLSPGRHVVELVRPGFAVERREVEIVDGEQNELLVELRAARP